MKATAYSAAITDELKQTLTALDDVQMERLTELVAGAERVFLAGAGRSLLMVKCCAMRLMQLGLKAYVVGETTTPSITPADLLLVVSGSGETATVSCMAGKAKRIGAKLALVTIVPDSTIGRMADVTVRIDASSTKVASRDVRASVQLGGSLFELSALLLLETLVMLIVEKKGICAPNTLLMQNHANLE